jgi:hypothetical protein
MQYISVNGKEGRIILDLFSFEIATDENDKNLIL